jgi:hypothetical protein
MMKSITRTMLTTAMGFAWDVIKTGERIIEASENWDVHEANERRAGFVELAVWRVGNAIAGMGVRLELGINRFAIWLGYSDGEVSGMVAWSV